MLGQRIRTAVVLLALFLPALFASSPWPFWGFTGLMILAAGWEWGRLTGLKGSRAILLGLLSVALSAWWFQPGSASSRNELDILWGVVALAWGLLGGLTLARGPEGWGRLAPRVRQSLGVIVLSLAWAAMLVARERGLNFLLSIFCLVWVADSAAYLGGRLLGRHKLAFTISPGKTWEGAFSGALAVSGLALAWTAHVDGASWADGPSVFGVLQKNLGPWGMCACTWVLTAMAVVGDLFESLLKRAQGVKDSSALLPGHGGVLDRIDALIPVFPAALALCVLTKGAA